MSHWSFAIVNGKLAEIHYDKMRDGTLKLNAHGYVNKNTFKTKKEQRYIHDDTKRMRFSWRNKKYRYLGKEPLRYITGSLKKYLKEK